MSNKKQKEGRRLRTIDPFTSIIPYIMVERSECQNHFEDYFNIEPAEALIKKLREEGYDSIGILHIILASYVRTVSQRPAINRFIRGQKVFARNGIVVNLDIKRRLSIDEPDTTVKFHFSPSDTLYDVYKTVNETINSAISAPTSSDTAARIIGYIPGLIKKFTIWFLKLLYYFNLLPSSLVEVSPFHGSMFITNMASLNIKPVTHHLYNFGNIPIFFAFGAKRTIVEYDRRGEGTPMRIIDYIVNLDERICDGYYYASSIKLMKYTLEHPEGLLSAPEKVIEDIR